MAGTTIVLAKYYNILRYKITHNNLGNTVFSFSLPFIISVVSFSGSCTCKHTHREESEGESQAQFCISHSEGYTEPFLAVDQNPDILWSPVDCSHWCMAPLMSAAARWDTLNVIPPKERFTRCAYTSGQIMRVVIQHARGISDGFLCLIHTVMNYWCAW